MDTKRTSSILISIGSSAALIAAGIWFLYDRYGHYYTGSGHWFMPYGMMGTGGGGMGVVMILFWIIVIVALVLLLSGIFSGRSHIQGDSRQEPDALQILKRRYANGEIDKAQFEAMRKDLNV